MCQPPTTHQHFSHPGYLPMYSAFEAFFNQLSGDEVVRTENPHEANLFYVPLFLFTLCDNAGDPYELARRGLLHVSERYPQFWGRNQGGLRFMGNDH